MSRRMKCASFSAVPDSEAPRISVGQRWAIGDDGGGGDGGVGDGEDGVWWGKEMEERAKAVEGPTA